MGIRSGVKIKAHSFMVFGQKWRIYFCTPGYYNESVDKTSKAITDLHPRKVFIDMEHLSEELLRHELTHVYAKECSLVELGLKGEQVEEFFCELVGKHGPQLNKQAKALFQYARKLKWKKDL